MCLPVYISTDGSSSMLHYRQWKLLLSHHHHGGATVWKPIHSHQNDSFNGNISMPLSFNQCVRGGALVPSGGGQDDSWKPKHTQTSRLFCLSCFFSLCSDIFLSCEILACVQHFWRDTWLLQESQITIHSVTDQRQKNPKQLLFSRPKSAHFLFCSRIAFFSFNSFIAACFLSSGLFQGGESKRGSWGIMPALVAVFFLKNKFKQTASYLWLVWALGSQLRFLSPGFLHREWY